MQSSVEIGRIVDVESDFDTGRAILQLTEQRWQAGDREGVTCSQPDLAFNSLAAPGNRIHFARQFECAPGEIEDLLAIAGQPRTIAAAIEQAHPQRLFELLD